MGKDVGDKIGPRIAALAGKYTTAARRDHAPVEAKIRQVATQALIDRAGREIAEHIGPLLHAAIEANPDMHPEVKRYLTRTASGKHQLQAIAGHLAMMGAGSVFGTLINNELAPLVYGIVASNPHLRFDQNTAAALHAAGIFTLDDSANEGNAQGYDTDRMAWLGQLAQTVPDPGTLGQLVNRERLTVSQAAGWTHRGAYPPEMIDALLSLREALLPPADCALAVLRGNLTAAQGETIAAKSGVSAEDFRTLIDNTGEPIALESLLEARRRDFIDDARLDLGVRQSRVRNEWIDVIHKLEFGPMSTADAVNGVVQGHLAEAQAAVIARQNGLEPNQLTTLIENAGEPLSRTELEQLYNRGEIDESVVLQGLRESRLKNKYIDDALKLHVRLPEGRQVSGMITHGALTKDQGIAILRQLGYSQEIATAIVTEGTNAKIGAHKDLTVAEIRALYIDGIFSKNQASGYLVKLSYDTAEADFLIKSWDLLAGAAITRQAVGVIRSRYVSRDLTAQQVNLELDALGIPATAKDNYLRVWNIEREARIAHLTEAQIVAAHKHALIDGQDAHDRLTAKGYSAGDANILLGVGPGDPVPA